MKAYNLTCIKCGEPQSVYIDAAKPNNLRCMSCDEEFSVTDVAGFVNGWNEYIADYKEMMAIGTSPGGEKGAK